MSAASILRNFRYAMEVILHAFHVSQDSLYLRTQIHTHSLPEYTRGKLLRQIAEVLSKMCRGEIFSAPTMKSQYAEEREPVMVSTLPLSILHGFSAPWKNRNTD